MPELSFDDFVSGAGAPPPPDGGMSFDDFVKGGATPPAQAARDTTADVAPATPEFPRVPISDLSANGRISDGRARPGQPVETDPTLGSVATQFGAHLPEGAAKGVGAMFDIVDPYNEQSPISVATAPLRTAGRAVAGALGYQQPQGANFSGRAGQAVKEAIGAPEPSNMPERIAARTGDEVGAFGVPVLGEGIGLLRAGTRAGQVAGMAAKNLGLGATAGAAAGAAREGVDPNDPQSLALVDLMASLGVGVGGPMAASVIRQGAAAPTSLFTQAGREARAAKALKIQPGMDAALDSAAADAPQIPGVTYSPAELLNDPSLLGQQRALERGALGDDAKATVLGRKQDNATALQEVRTAEGPGGNPEAAREAAQQRVGQATDYVGDRTERTREAAQAQLEQAQTAARTGVVSAEQQAADLQRAAQDQAAQATTGARTAAEQVGREAQVEGAQKIGQRQTAIDQLEQMAGQLNDRTVQAAQTGAETAPQRFRESATQARTEAKAATTQAYKAADSTGEALWPTEDIHAAAERVMQRQTRVGDPANLPSVLRGDAETNGLAQLGQRMTLQELDAFRKRMGAEMSQAQRAGNNVLAMNAGELMKGAENALDKVDAVIPRSVYSAEAELPSRSAVQATGTEAGRGLQDSGRPLAGGAGTVDEAATAAEIAGRPTASADATLGNAGAARQGDRGGSASIGEPGSVAPGPDVAGGSSEDAGRLREALKAARTVYREQMVPQKTGLTAALHKVQPNGLQRVATEDSIRHFVMEAGTRGAETAAQELTGKFGSHPEMMQAVSDWMVGRMADMATKSGRLSVPRMEEFQRRYAPLLDQMPELSAEMQNRIGLQKRLDGEIAARHEALGTEKIRAAVTQQMADLFGKDLIKSADTVSKKTLRAAEMQGKDLVDDASLRGSQTVEKAKTEGKASVQQASANQKLFEQAMRENAARFWLDSDPKTAVSRALGSNDNVKASQQLMRVVRKDPDAIGGARQAAWEVVLDNVLRADKTAGTKGAETTSKWMDKNRPALRTLLGDDKLARVDDLLDAATILRRADKAVAPGSNSVPDAIAAANALKRAGQTVLGKLMTIGGGAIGGHLGGVGGAVGGGAVGLVADSAIAHRVDLVKGLMADALNNPETFKLLVSRVNKMNEKDIQRRIAMVLENQLVVNTAMASANQR